MLAGARVVLLMRRARRRGLATVVDASRVKVTRHGAHIAVVTLARPSKLNALDLRMFDAVKAAAEDLRGARDVRCVVLRGEGRAFCAGLDVQSIATTARATDRLLERRAGKDANLAQAVSVLWRRVPAPVVAAVHGVCFGGGFQIALGADVRISTKSAKFSVMEAKWGLIPDMGASITFPDAMPRDVALDITLTGRIFDAQEAKALRLVTRVVEGEDALPEALNFAEAVAARSPDSSAGAKRLFHAAYDADRGDDRRLLHLESHLQRRLLGGWNQLVSSARGLGLPAALVPGFLSRSEVWSQEADDEAELKLQGILRGVGGGDDDAPLPSKKKT